MEKENKDNNKKEENKDDKQAKQEKEVKIIKNTVLLELKSALNQLDKSVTNNDSRNFLKISKQLRRFKKAMKPHHIQKVIALFYPENNQFKFEQYQEYQPNFEEQLEIQKSNVQKLLKCPEIELYLQLLLLIFLVQNKDLDNAYQLAEQLLNKAKGINKRSFDYLNSLIYFYYARTRELKNELLDIREELYEAYRTSCIRHDEIGQATLLNLLLRNYLHFNEYEQAQLLISRTNFPEQKSNNEYCRFLYYTGRIKAITLQYAESLSKLNQAIRKSPDTTALGFRVEVQKLAIVVELLLGEIPSRTIFAQADMQKPLLPYYRLVQSVLKGNLLDYAATVEKYKQYYINDKLYTLIQRLHQMVIKTGLRKINLSYSKISFIDIAQKLNLPANTNVELIVAKAIRDGILNAYIDHEKQCIVISEKKDLYTTNEPSTAFQKRIQYCLNLYNSSTKALQYPHSNYQYEQRDNKDDISAEDLLKLVADSDDF